MVSYVCLCVGLSHGKQTNNCIFKATRCSSYFQWTKSHGRCFSKIFGVAENCLCGRNLHMEHFFFPFWRGAGASICSKSTPSIWCPPTHPLRRCILMLIKQPYGERERTALARFLNILTGGWRDTGRNAHLKAGLQCFLKYANFFLFF